jgi:hypothetical protein
LIRLFIRTVFPGFFFLWLLPRRFRFAVHRPTMVAFESCPAYKGKRLAVNKAREPRHGYPTKDGRRTTNRRANPGRCKI